MAVYLETNALRKLTNYDCDEPVYTSIFSIFELLSGMSEKDFQIRKACLERISNGNIKIQGPMIDQLLMEMIGENGYNAAVCQKIYDTYQMTLSVDCFSAYKEIKLLIKDDKSQKEEEMSAYTWLSNWDKRISQMTTQINKLFEDENKDYIKRIYEKKGEKGLADYFWDKFSNNKIDEERLSHAEGFVGAEVVEKFRQEMDGIFSKNNFELFMTAQAVIFSKAHLINGGSQNSNNASDLLHLLYLDEGDLFVSNDKIYQTISGACPKFNLIVLHNERNLSDLNINL